ncbi:Fic family protein [Desulfolucanica intricata]|uniref:Fic family protein n=1 Tax=Desulfolucanica intricata TaxID=1285191 RepID=UPI00082CBE0A|nr:Fic family protein [Desulfolucanica intricata]
MTYKPRFDFTNDIVLLLNKIEYYRGLVDSKTLPLHISEKLKNRARLKTTHYSTYIEGNQLSLQQVEEVVSHRPNESESYHEQEVRNYWRALAFLRKAKGMKMPITEELIKKLHRIIEVRGPGRRGKKSQYRGATPPGVLFCIRDSKTGNVEYIPPYWEEVPGLMKELVDWVNSNDTLPVPIKAAITAYQLVTIHPFDDCNGRLARALSLYILMLNDYDLNGYFTVEEYYANNLQLYYDSLQMGLPVEYYNGRNDPLLNPWITFFLTTMADAFKDIADSTIRLYDAAGGKLLELSQREVRLLQLALRWEGRPLSLEVMADWFEVSKRTMQEWVKDWMTIGLLVPASGKKRITSYKLGPRYSELRLSDIE